MLGVSRSVYRPLVPFLMFFICVLAQMSCQCSANPVPAIVTGVIACQSQHEALGVVYNSADGFLGVGFSILGASASVTASAPVCACAAAAASVCATASVSAPVPDSKERKPG